MPGQLTSIFNTSPLSPLTSQCWSNLKVDGVSRPRSSSRKIELNLLGLRISRRGDHSLFRCVHLWTSSVTQVFSTIGTSMLTRGTRSLVGTRNSITCLLTLNRPDAPMLTEFGLDSSHSRVFRTA